MENKLMKIALVVSLVVNLFSAIVVTLINITVDEYGVATETESSSVLTITVPKTK